jgi:uncharacterized protein
MTVDKYIKEIIASVPSKRVEGKKRLQKLVFLVSEAGFPVDAKFFLKDYGPFSRDVEIASDFMSIFGELIESSTQTGYSNYIATVYELPSDQIDSISPSEDFSEVVRIMDSFRTVELEIASTIRYFQDQGLPFSSALHETREMKPSKSTDKVIGRAKEILSYLPGINASATNS